MAQLYIGDALDVLKTLPEKSCRCCVTSPPYWGLRDYGYCDCAHFRVREGSTNDGGAPNYRSGRPKPDCRKCRGTGRLAHSDAQLGLERTPEEYIEKMVDVFREVRRVLTDDGTLWLVLGDSYATGGGSVGECPGGGKQGENWKMRGVMTPPNRMRLPGLKPKDLVGIPWRVAFALQADGWYLRSDIIWAKPNPMPESVRDRPTKNHEYVFLLSKAERYYYDADAIAEPTAWPDGPNAPDAIKSPYGQGYSRRASGNKRRKGPQDVGRPEDGSAVGRGVPWSDKSGLRNTRSVWTISTCPYPEAHFATFPPELAERCIKAGSASGDTVLDPFGGSGTTAAVATGHGRDSIYIDLNPGYIELARNRIGPMLCEVVEKREAGL